MTEEYAEHLKKLISRAGYSHRLKPVVSMAEVEKFEKKFNKKLPSEYKFFLTQVSNGAIGPHYLDLFSLKRLEEENFCNKIDKSLPYSEPLTSFKPHLDLQMTYPKKYTEWRNNFCEPPDLFSSEDIDKNISVSEQANLLIIGHRGNVDWQIVLMLGEAEENQVRYLDYVNWKSVSKFYTPTGCDNGKFFGWYENLLNELIHRRNIDNYGDQCLKSEREIREKYSTLVALEDKIQWIFSLDRFNHLEPATLDFMYSLIDNKDLDELIIRLFLHTHKRFEPVSLEYGIKAFEYALKYNPAAAARNVLWVPAKFCDKYYDRFIELLYAPSFYNSIELIRYLFIGIEKCSNKKTADVMNFAVHKNDDEIFIAIQIYLVNSSDYAEYESFIDSRLN